MYRWMNGLWMIGLWMMWGCDGDAPPPPVAEARAGPDILLVTIDTLRADRVGAYGDKLAQTPSMDKLAREGVLFREAHSVTPLTLPSHASLLTGLYPSRHKLRDNAGFRLDSDVATLAEALQTAGYRTGAFVSAFVLDGAWGLDQGFDVYRDPFHPSEVAAVGAFGEVELPGADVVNAARAWWREARGPRFAWVHLYDPHTPWTPHGAAVTDPYRSEVGFADGLLGRLLSDVGDDALVVVTSDHGEGLWHGGEREHGVLLGPEVTRVPLIIRPPGGAKPATVAVTERAPAPVPVRRPDGIDPDLELSPVRDAPVAARVVEQPVSGVDVAPTIADWARVSLVADGRSLRPLIEGGTLVDLPVYAETWFPYFHYGWSGLQMARDANLRIEVGTRLEASADGDTRALEAVIATHTADGPPTPGEVDSATAAALEALGYLSAVVEVTGERPDPRDEIEILGVLHAAESVPDPEARLARLQALVNGHPNMVDARIALSLARAETGALDAALQDNLEVLRRWPEHPTALSNAAVLAWQVKQPDKAVELSRRMQVLNPADPRGFRTEAAVWVEREDPDEVLRVTRAGLAVAPEDPNLHYLAALAELQIGDPLVAVEHLDKARAHGSRANDLSLWLGAAHQRAGRIDDARTHYDAAIRDMPGDPRPWGMAGWMLYKAGRCADAAPYLVNISRRGGGRDPKIREALEACSKRAPG